MEKQLIYLPTELRIKIKEAIAPKRPKVTISNFVQNAVEFYLSSLEKNKETATV